MSVDRKAVEKICRRKTGNFLVGFVFAVLIFGTSAGFSFAQSGSNTEKIRDLSATPEKLSASFAEVSRRVEPAVVNIDTKGKVPEVTLKGEKPSEQSDDIAEFYRRLAPRRPSSAVGSGLLSIKPAIF